MVVGGWETVIRGVVVLGILVVVVVAVVSVTARPCGTIV
jgi:hypothetical protein